MTGPRLLEGRRALVTGAGGGLGSAIARRLAGAGAAVALHDRDADLTRELAQEIALAGHTATSVHGDVRDPEAVAGFVAEAARSLGGLDLLVNNAGMMEGSPFLDLDPDAWRRVIDTNLTGYFLVGQSAARLMVAGGGGAVVNVSSTRQVQAAPGNAAYAASKGGVAMLTRVMAMELAPLGVRVNSVAPGTIETNLNRHYVNDPEFRAGRLATIPLGRYGIEEEVADAVLFLSSPMAEFVVGASLLVDGGQTLG